LREATIAAPRRTPISDVELELVDPRTNHLLTLVDDCGIVQHAHGGVPNRQSGYCIDDVARLTVVALELEQRTRDRIWISVLYRALAFLHDATDGPGMRNFMSYDRRWLDEPHVGDHVGRSVWALGDVLSTAWVPAAVGPARRLLATLVDSLKGELSHRTAAYTILGLARLDPDRLDASGRSLLERCVKQLEDALEAHAVEGWHWFEERLTYDNARLPHALIVGGVALDRDDAVKAGLDSLAWLGDESGLAEGLLRLTGHLGRTKGEPASGGGDEQPLDASAFVEAELAAFGCTGDPEHGARAQASFEWFLGRNRLGLPLYDFATGGCGDGLGEEAVSENEGAESTLAFHRAQLVLDAAGLPRVLRRGSIRPRATA
jgi:hypothetical protein